MVFMWVGPKMVQRLGLIFGLGLWACLGGVGFDRAAQADPLEGPHAAVTIPSDENVTNFGGKPLVVHLDRGGVLPRRERELQNLRASGRRVELRGTCISACTMYLSLANVCVSPNAVFGFHGPSYYGKPLSPAGFEKWSNRLARHYREPLRSWFMQVARYELVDYYQLSGRQLISMGYRAC